MAFPYSSSDQSSYSYPTSSYSTTSIPSYTQSQVNAYYQQYQCYPAQPYQIIPDYYVHPAQTVAYAAPAMSSSQGYYAEGAGNMPAPDPSKLAPPEDEDRLRQHRKALKADRRNRSPSRPRTWTCDFPGCTSTANFTRLADLQRHQSTVHGIGTPDFPCTVPRCTRVGDKGFTRRDHLVEHLRNFHHLDIPKRRPGERSANPLGIPPHYQQQ